MLGSEAATAMAPMDCVGSLIEDGIPGAAVVVRLPDAAVHLADVENIGLAGYTGGGASAATAKRADHAPVQFLVCIFGNLCPERGGRQENQQRHK